jgi:hypothetical protein
MCADAPARPFSNMMPSWRGLIAPRYAAPMENKDSNKPCRAAELHALAAKLRAQAAATAFSDYAEKMRRTAEALEAEALALERA